MSDGDLEFSSLFARPSFRAGVASLFDWAGALNQYTVHEFPKDADNAALRHDAYVIGRDLKKVLGQVAEYGEAKA